MYADGVEVFHRADGEHVARAVAQNFELNLLPAANVAFDEHLGYGREHKAVVRDETELLFIVCNAAAGAAQSVSGTDDYGVAAYSVGHLHALVDSVCDIGGNDGLAYLVHRLFEELSVLGPVDRVDVYAYELYAIFVEEALLCQLAAERKTRLAAERGQKTVGPLLYYNSL